MTMTQPTTQQPLDLTQPLALRANQREAWHNFPGQGVTFYEAASQILAADAKDGERRDLGITALNTYAFGPGPDGTASLATIPAPGRARQLIPLREHAFGQLCGRVKAPVSYMKRLPAKLQMACINHGIQSDAEQNGNTLRLAGGEARALLSDRYAALDNHVIIEVMEQVLRAAGMLADVRVRSISTGPTASMRLTLPDDDRVIENPRKVGDIVESGFDLLNGEIGNRSVLVGPVVWRLVCLNGMRSADRSAQQRLRHVGDPERLVEAFRDAVPSALAASRGLRDRMAKAVDVLVDDILAEFDGLRQFGLTTQDTRDVARDVFAERELALPESTDEWAQTIAQVRDVTAYDVLNGVTHVAQRKGTDRRLEMEEAAGRYLRRRVAAA
jgi:hypothetical protein